MNKDLWLTPATWKKLKEKLKEDYPPSVMLIRSKMRSKLGFTDRRHTHWSNDNPRVHVILDFYSEKKRTFFIMKYSEFLPNGQNY